MLLAGMYIYLLFLHCITFDRYQNHRIYSPHNEQSIRAPSRFFLFLRSDWPRNILEDR